MLRGRGGKDVRHVKPIGSLRSGNSERSGGASVRRTSSRGMVYENEAMRFATLEMASEVDRQHSDMRKLRRENDQLKQQLWTMRDEYQRLEQFVEELEEVALEDIEEEDDDDDGDDEQLLDEEGCEQEAAEAEVRGCCEGAVGGQLDMPAFDAEFALRGGAGAAGGSFTVIIPDQPAVVIPDIPSSSPDGLPDPDQFFSPTKHFNLDQLMDIVQSFHAERDHHCLGAARRRASAADDGAAAADDPLGAAMLCGAEWAGGATEPTGAGGMLVTNSRVAQTTTADGSRTVTFRRDSMMCMSSAHSRCSSETTTRSSPSDASVARYVSQQPTLVRINCVEPNTLMFSTRQVATLHGLSATHVIDELERQFDSQLCEVRGVRVVADTAYICLGSRTSLLTLLGGGLRVRGVPVSLVDITHDSTVVMMAGVPHYISDGSIHILMDTFGTVIGEIERRFYKGVDTGDRFVRVKLREGVKVPRYVTVGGNRILMRVVPADEVGCALRPEQCRVGVPATLYGTEEPGEPGACSQSVPLPPACSGPGRSESGDVVSRSSAGIFAGTGVCPAGCPVTAANSSVQSGSLERVPPMKHGFTSRLQVQLRPRSAPEAAPARDSAGSVLSAPGDVASSPSDGAHLSLLVNTSDGPDSSPQPPAAAAGNGDSTPNTKRKSRKPLLPRIKLPGTAAVNEGASTSAAVPASSSSELDSSSKSSPDKPRRVAPMACAGTDLSAAKTSRSRTSLNSSPTKSMDSRDSPLKQRGSVAFDESSGADSPTKRRTQPPRLQANGGILRRQFSEPVPGGYSPQPSPDSLLRRRALGDPVRAKLAERIERRRTRSLRRDSEASELSVALDRRGSEGAGSQSSRGTRAGGSLPDSSDVPWCGCWGNGCF